MSEEPRKRSRFDQAPSEEPPRKSRFDRRSRSPSTKDPEASARERSPVKSVESPAAGEKKDEAKDPAAIAAAAAARISASLQKSKGIQQVEVPPIRKPSTAEAGASKSPSAPAAGSSLSNDIYQQDGDFIKDIEVNDLRNRYTLTKGSTQKMIKEETGADVTTRGNYYPDKSMATAANPPLYLHVTSTTKDGLEQAVKKIEELMQQELPNLIDERRFRRREEPREQPDRDHLGRRKWPEKQIPIDLEPIPGFNLRAQVVGSGGSYVKHIQQETRCRVQIKGRGSGFMEHDTGRESDEQMYLHVAGPEQAMVDSAEEMCKSLLDSVRQQYQEFKERPARGPGGGRGGYGGDDRGGYHGRGGDRQNSGSYGGGSAYGNGGGSAYGGAYGATGQPDPYAQANPYDQYAQAAAQGYGSAQSPTAAQQGAAAAAPTDPAEQQKQYEAWAAYYAANPQADPYAAYGGYAAVMAQYMQPGAAAAAAQYQGYGQPSQTPVDYSNGVPPPPPQDGQQATSGPPGAYNPYSAVPPPPGM
ncbi:hypothetical protein CKM354_000744000 [Cercospora kikuchii]|uniref:K Homology domain-containing protein n=1 Tax=Cercospora kikuchii TaxID=84275 RepID=A0A9P3FEA9_9PEZI|nr:uncharacterized protein CKM354_000744000 [Cercospora kikuchii]GIZ44236.1 hypothetical protein CKM354_000744000 [Cercospora kikuchii]